jgi:hypothetical protein
MKRQITFTGWVGLALLAVIPLWAAETTLYTAKSGSKMRMEGTSNVHDWQAESPFIRGFLEAGPDFPHEPGQTINPGKANGRVEVSIPVKALKSVKSDGKPYDDKMDEVMWENLKVEKCPQIVYRSTELTLKEAPKSKDAPYLLDSKGDLLVAGVTNRISLPVSVLPLGDKKLKISGSITVKMTDFGMKPIEKDVVVFKIKTGDDVKLSFEWMLWQKPPAAPAAGK